MGFSLGRALAGALAGGAGAVAQIADNEIRNAEKRREEAVRLEQQRTIMQEQDALAGARAERAIKLKEDLDNRKIEKQSIFMKTGLASLREQGIDSGSIAGQRQLAAAAGEAGHPELADKFFDNAIKLGQIETTAETNREAARIRLETARLGRESINAQKELAKESRDEQYNQNKIANMAQIEFSDRDGQKQKINAYGQFTSLFQEAKEQGYSNKDALAAVSAASALTGRAIREKANPDAALDAAISTAAVWRKAKPASPGAATPVPPIVQAGPPSSAMTIPGAFDSVRQRGNANDPDAYQRQQQY